MDIQTYLKKVLVVSFFLFYYCSMIGAQVPDSSQSSNMSEETVQQSEEIQKPLENKKKHKTGFEQYVFIPELSMSAAFAGVGADAIQGLGPSIGIDMIFTKAKSGFSFFIHNNTALWFNIPSSKNKNSNDDYLLFIPVTMFHFMFGYTHGRGTDLEISAGIGPCFVPMPPCLGLSSEITLIKYFSKKYGIAFSVLNGFTFIPFGVSIDPKTGKRQHGILFADMLNISIGFSFRL